MGTHQMELEATSAAFAPILNEVASLIAALGIPKSGIKSLLVSDGRCFAALIDYLFERYVPGFAMLDQEGYYKLIYDPEYFEQ